MNPWAVAAHLAQIVVDVLRGRATPGDAAKRILDAAIATGVPANVLASYLSEASARRAEIVADMAQAAKLGPR